MKKFLLALAFVSAFATAVYSQGTTPPAKPTPTPVPSDDQEVVKISTNLVQIDVTVTDGKGRIVTDLKPDEIEIYQNGKKQDISNFSFISNKREITEGGEQKLKLKPQTGVILPATPIKAENVKRAIALVVDDLNLSFESMAGVQQALRKFVDEQMREGDLVAIIRTGAGIGALQQFTNDKRQLYAAIDKIRFNASGTGNVGAFAPLQGKHEIEASMPISPDAQNQELDDFRASVFATGTLGALNYVVRGMADLPGRKSIMLLSDGFAMYTKDADGNRDSSRVYDAIQVLADRATRASVVIYTMDPRGLVYTGITAQDNTMGRTKAQVRDVESGRQTQIIETQEGLKYLAEETGGTAFMNNNDISMGIRKILDDQSYYLIGYLPDDSTFDPNTRKFNTLSVKVSRPETKVRYRSGFFNISSEKKVETSQQHTANKLADALTSPFAVNEVSLRLNSLFGNSVLSGAYIRSLLHIRTQDITFSDAPNGGKKATIDVMAVAFGENGNAVDQFTQTMTFTVRKDVYAAYLKNGFVGDFVFPIKKPGAYQLRIAVRDHGSEKVGSANQFIEVPDVSRKRLSLSGVALENISFETWKKRSSGGARNPVQEHSRALIDTALRQFKRGTVLNYALSIFNARQGDVTSRVMLFRDGKLVFEGKPIAVTAKPRGDTGAIPFEASMSLGTEMVAGDYVMEIAITDNNAKDKQKTATQFVQFEIVE